MLLLTVGLFMAGCGIALLGTMLQKAEGQIADLERRVAALEVR